MPDTVLTRDGPVGVPMDYVVPQGGELLPLTVRATMTGTSATHDYYATVQVIAPSGRVMGSYISSVIAAGASADVTWFRGVGTVTAPVGSDVPITETLFLDSHSSGASNAVTASTVFASGQGYIVTVEGTVSDWNLALDQGTPDSNPIYPSSGVSRVSTQVGIDADTLYAYPTSQPEPIGHWTQFEIDLGSGFAHREPHGGPYTTPQTGHIYTYSLTGQGVAPSFRWNDTPLTDNYGRFKIVILGIPSPTVQTITSSGSSITVTNPTGPTTNLDLPASGVTAGTYGDALDVAQVTLDAKGRVTAATNVPIASGAGGGIIQVSKVTLTSGDLTTSSTSFVDATGLTTTLTTGAHRCVVLFTASGNVAASLGNVAVDLAIDGTRQGQAYGLVLGQDFNSGVSSLNHNLSFTYLTAALSAGAHTLKIQWRVDAGTGTLFASTTVTPAILTVLELGV